MRQYVLDANALLRFIINADGAEMVEKVLKEATASETRVVMSVVNWGEVYYTMARRIGLAKTDQLLTETLEKTHLWLIQVDQENIAKVARLKAQNHDVPYADCFAAALAGSRHVLVTAAVKHFERVRTPKLRLLKLPPAKQ